jgi:hypothetical protein
MNLFMMETLQNYDISSLTQNFLKFFLFINLLGGKESEVRRALIVGILYEIYKKSELEYKCFGKVWPPAV